MEYQELALYNRQGGEAFTQKNVTEKKVTSLSEKDKNLLKLYKKKIIEQRQEIENLKKKLKKYEK
mgnify:CR=1 FL=1|tara:strand:- start:387 stop:581 length:195 start_codon:yes stop_codon:yes gene_type:complete